MKIFNQWFLYFVTAFFLCVFLFVPVVYAVDSTKAQGILMDWTLLDDTASAAMTVETAELDSGEGLDASVVAYLHIDMAHCTADAAGDLAGVSVLIKSGTTDETWHEFIRWSATGGTAVLGDVNDTTGSGQAVIELASTTNYETPGDVYFLLDAGTMADSCLVQMQGVYANDDWITVIDNLVNAYDSSDELWDIVDQWTFTLPPSIQAAKVLFYNTDADCNYACRVHYTLVTDIE